MLCRPSEPRATFRGRAFTARGQDARKNNKSSPNPYLGYPELFNEQVMCQVYNYSSPSHLSFDANLLGYSRGRDDARSIQGGLRKHVGNSAIALHVGGVSRVARSSHAFLMWVGALRHRLQQLEEKPPLCR